MEDFMEDLAKKDTENRIKNIKDNLYSGGGQFQGTLLLDLMMSSLAQKEFTGASDISIDTVLSIISTEIKHLKQIVRDGGIISIKTFEESFKGLQRPHGAYACLDKNLKFCVKHYGEEDWKDILYVFPYMNCNTAFDISFKKDNIHSSDMNNI